MKLIFDSSALIPASKYAVEGRRICEYLVEYVDIHVPIAVAQETVVNPDKFASEAVLYDLISQRKIIIEAVHPTNEGTEILAGYKLGPGEQEAILLYLQNPKKYDGLVLDDYVATIVCRRLQIESMLLLDLVVQLGREGMMPGALAVDMISKVAPRYSRGFIEHSLQMLNADKVIREQPPIYVREMLEPYIAGKFSQAGMSREEADLRQRLAQSYYDYAAGQLSLGWMARHLRLSLPETDELLERMKLPVATGVEALAIRLQSREALATVEENSKSVVHRAIQKKSREKKARNESPTDR